MTVALQRTTDVSAVNDLANDPAIRPTIGVAGDEPVDLSPLLENERNVVLSGKHGSFAFIWCAPACYEAHPMVREAGRGPWSISAAKAGLDAMFDIYGAQHVWGRVRTDLANVRAFTVAVGLEPCGVATFDFEGEPKEYHLYERRA